MLSSSICCLENSAFSSFKLASILLAGIYCLSVTPILRAEVYAAPTTSSLGGLNRVANMHGDAQSSDTTPFAGPGVQALDIKRRFLAAACPTILIRSDGKPFVLCTSYFGRKPVVRLLDHKSGTTLGKLALKAGNLLGGVYAILDDHDQLVIVDGNQHLLFIAAVKAQSPPGNRKSNWTVEVVKSIDLSPFVRKNCAHKDCDSVVSLGMTGDGMIWFATQNALVGTYDPKSENINTLSLGTGERIYNSLSTTADGEVAIVTDQALYVLKHDGEHGPAIAWRAAYDRGSARKPGNQSHGSGVTPSFFGPDSGSEYVTIADNADAMVSLIVRKTMDGSLVCLHPLFTPGNSGTENSSIAIGNTVVVSSTFGYRYPALPEGAGDSVPKSAEFVGGMMRIDVNEDGTGCKAVWSNQVRSAAVAKLSLADGYIYTVERQKRRGLDTYDFIVMESKTGNVTKQTRIGKGFLSNTLQMAGNVDPNGVYWQGTLGGISRLEAH